MRLTKQRKIILEKLKSTTTHPTAVEVYDEVRKELPNISLGTVYRNLETLSQQGLIQKLESCGDQKRFDGMAEPHLHVICTQCGRVRDVPEHFHLDLDRLTQANTDYKITGVRLELLGICPECNQESH